jgi:hypothetical protein
MAACPWLCLLDLGVLSTNALLSDTPAQRHTRATDWWMSASSIGGIALFFVF